MVKHPLQVANLPHKGAEVFKGQEWVVKEVLG